MNKETSWLLREKYSGKETPAFIADLKRLQRGEPLAYVIGWVEFLGAKIDLSERPLIPRPETEWWVENVIAEIARGRSNVGNERIKILDLFAGSGCIGVALLKHLTNARVDLGEKDSNFCAQIRKNLRLNRLSKRACVIETDVFSNVDGKYDRIFANPPYIDRAKKGTVQKSVLKHEPHEALFAKERGLFFFRKLLREARAHLVPEGVLYAEFGIGQKSALARLARARGWDAKFHKDQYGKWRYVELRRSHLRTRAPSAMLR